MAQILFSEVISYVRYAIPDIPQAKIGWALNLTLEDLYERLRLHYYSTFTTRATTTTGTVAVTAGATTVTFSSSVIGTDATDGMRVVQIGDDATWYVLTRTNGTTGELSSKFAGATNATATYKIAYPTVVFPAGVGSVRVIRRVGLDLELTPTAGTEFASRPFSSSTGTPLFWAPYAFDGDATPNDAHRVLLTPFPETAESYSYEYDARPTLVDPAAGSPSSVNVAIPTQFRRPLLFGTVALCWMGQDQESSDLWLRKAEEAFKNALATGGKEASGQREGAYGQRRGFYALQDRPSA